MRAAAAHRSRFDVTIRPSKSRNRDYADDGSCQAAKFGAACERLRMKEPITTTPPQAHGQRTWNAHWQSDIVRVDNEQSRGRAATGQ